jgi:hypothetical protein
MKALGVFAIILSLLNLQNQEFDMNVENQMNVRREVQSVVDLFNKVHDKKYNGYAYGAGYLGSMLSEVISNLPKRKREIYVKQLMRTIQENV